MAMDETRHNFLANPGLSCQQNSGVSLRNALGHREQVPACLVNSHDAAGCIISGQFVFIDMRQQRFRLEGFEEKVAGA